MAAGNVRSSQAGQVVAVYAATGHTGRFVVAELLRRGFVPVAVRSNRQPPRTHLLGRELHKTHSTQFGGRLPQQPAELGDGDAFTLMRLQVLGDPLAQRQRRRAAVGHQPRQLVPERPLRLSPTGEPANLQPRRPAARNAIPVRPHWLPLRRPLLQPEHLTLLNHLNLLDRQRDRGITPTRR
jgi:hypothetical protein